MKTLRPFLTFCVLSLAAFAAEEPPPESPAPPAFEEYSLTVEGLGEITIIAPEGEPGYRARLVDGRVTAFPSVSGEPSEANAAADIAYAIANPPAAAVPTNVTRRQLLLALLNGHAITRAAIRTQLEAIADATARESALIEFEEATEFERAHPLVATLAAAFELTTGQVDDVFRTAAGL